MLSLKYSAAAWGAAILLAACQPDATTGLATKQSNYNRGEAVILSLVGEGACHRCFNLYRTMPSKKAFALSRSGTFSYANGKKSRVEAEKAALSSCRARNARMESAKPCKLLMSGDRFVWN